MGDISRVVLCSTAELFDHQEAEEEEKKEENSGRFPSWQTMMKLHGDLTNKNGYSMGF